jgi:Protein of unknown function (DUF3592)
LLIEAPLPNARKRRLIRAGVIATALLSGYLAVSRAAERHDSVAWPAASARVLASSVYHDSKSHRDCLGVRYQYVVDSQTYESSSWSLNSKFGCYRAQADFTLAQARLQAGAAMRIHYKPADPATAVIAQVGPGLPEWLFGALAVALLLIGIRARNWGTVNASPAAA